MNRSPRSPTPLPPTRCGMAGRTLRPPCWARHPGEEEEEPEGEELDDEEGLVGDDFDDDEDEEFDDEEFDDEDEEDIDEELDDEIDDIDVDDDEDDDFDDDEDLDELDEDEEEDASTTFDTHSGRCTQPTGGVFYLDFLSLGDRGIRLGECVQCTRGNPRGSARFLFAGRLAPDPQTVFCERKRNRTGNRVWRLVDAISFRLFWTGSSRSQGGRSFFST